VGDDPVCLKFPLKVTHPFEKRRLRQISAYNVSTVRDSEKSSIMTNIKWTTDFNSNELIDYGVRTLPLSPERMAQKRFKKEKFNFNRIKSATKCLCVKLPAAKL